MKLTEVTLHTVFSLWLAFFSKKYNLYYIFLVSIFVAVRI